MKRELTKEEIILNLKKGLQVCDQTQRESTMYGWVKGLLTFIEEEEVSK